MALLEEAITNTVHSLLGAHKRFIVTRICALQTMISSLNTSGIDNAQLLRNVISVIHLSVQQGIGVDFTTPLLINTFIVIHPVVNTEILHTIEQ